NVLYVQQKFDEALGYHQRALIIREKFHGSDHGDTATSLNNIGNTLGAQGKYAEALDYHHRALQIREKFHPSGHTYIAV
ncbi:unnamed protein product, partial [Rotaria magnacalcarata]